MKRLLQYGAVLIVIAGVLLAVAVPELRKGQQPSLGKLPSATPIAASSLPQATSPSATSTPTGTSSSTAPQQDVQERIAALEAQLQTNPTDVAAIAELGSLYFTLRVYPRAADAFSSALELDPQNAKLRNDLGTALMYQGMLGLAKREYLQSMALDPTLPEPHYNMAIILSHGSPPDIPGALVEWREVIRLTPDSEMGRTAEKYIQTYQATP